MRQRCFDAAAGIFTLFSDDEVQWTLDGEDGGSWDEVDLFNHQQVLPIICGDEALEDISSQMGEEPV